MGRWQHQALRSAAGPPLTAAGARCHSRSGTGSGPAAAVIAVQTCATGRTRGKGGLGRPVQTSVAKSRGPGCWLLSLTAPDPRGHFWQVEGPILAHAQPWARKSGTPGGSASIEMHSAPFLPVCAVAVQCKCPALPALILNGATAMATTQRNAPAADGTHRYLKHCQLVGAIDVHIILDRPERERLVWDRPLGPGCCCGVAA